MTPNTSRSYSVSFRSLGVTKQKAGPAYGVALGFTITTHFPSSQVFVALFYEHQN